MAQHPDFLRFASAFKQDRFDEALALIDGLVAQFPQAAALRWHRALCLEQLERYDGIRPELDALLALKPDYAPAIIKRVQFADVELDGADDGFDDEDLDDATREAREREASARALAHSHWAEAELRRALALAPDDVEGLNLLSDVLRYREGADPAREQEAGRLLDRAIALAPTRIDLLEARANHRRSAAARDDASDDDDTVQTFSGLRYARAGLEAALEDYARCHALGGHYRYAVRMGMVLHDLGRYDEALARYDEALAAMAPDDPMRDVVLDTRARSEHNGAGEREQLAKLLESALAEQTGDRSAEDDMAAQALLGAADAIRAGKPVSEALEARLSDDPDTMVAINIAQQILNVAHEAPPELEAVDAKDYPGYQRAFADRVSKAVAPLGLLHVADAEARGLFRTLGQHVLLRFFRDDSGETGIAAFAVKPKWPGWIAFLLMLLTGKWRVTRMVECVTQFDDGAHLSTQHDNPSPFEFEGHIRIERLPARTPVAALVARHLERVAAYKAEHPGAQAMVATDLDGMERRWREGQRVKRAYRASVGYITEPELKRLLGAHHARFGDKVRTQLALLAADYSA